MDGADLDCLLCWGAWQFWLEQIVLLWCLGWIASTFWHAWTCRALIDWKHAWFSFATCAFIPAYLAWVLISIWWR